MIRVLAFVVAVAFGLGAALMFATAPTVQVDGQAHTCTALVVGAEGDGLPPAPQETGVADACGAKQQTWAVLAGLSALVALGAGSVAWFTGRPADVVRGGRRENQLA